MVWEGVSGVKHIFLHIMRAYACVCHLDVRIHILARIHHLDVIV